MILTCDKCFTRYVVDPSAIYVSGRTVRCSKCGNSWVQHNEEVDEGTASSREELFPQSKTLEALGLSALPTGGAMLPIIRVARTPPPPFWIKLFPSILLLLLVLLGLVLYRDSVLRIVPEIKPLYDVIGMESMTGIALRNISLSEEEDGIYVHGTLVNESTESRRTPFIRITILDADKRPIASHTLPASDTMLAPTAEIPLRSKLPAGVEEAEFVAIDAGNKIDLLLR